MLATPDYQALQRSLNYLAESMAEYLELRRRQEAQVLLMFRWKSDSRVAGLPMLSDGSQDVGIVPDWNVARWYPLSCVFCCTSWPINLRGGLSLSDGCWCCNPTAPQGQREAILITAWERGLGAGTPPPRPGTPFLIEHP